MAHLHNRELPQAQQAILDGLALARTLRMPRYSLQIRLTWEALQYTGWTEERLNELQRAWEAVDLRTQQIKEIEMERATLPWAFQQARKEHPLECICGECYKALNERLIHLSWAFRLSYHTEKLALENYQVWIEAFRAFAKDKAAMTLLKNAETKYALIRDKFRNREFDRGIVQNLGAWLRQVAYSEARRRMTVTAIALKRFHVGEGRYPALLSELSPRYIAAVLLDPMDQKPLRYRLQADGEFVLYSIGFDGVDGGGVCDLRSLFIDNGEDILWPIPAPPSEVQRWQQSLKQQEPGRRRYSE